MGHGSSQTVPYGDPITVKTPPSLLCLFLSSDSGSELILTQIFSRALRLYIMVSRADQQTEHTRTGSCAQTIVLPTLRSEPTQNFDYIGSSGKWLRKACQSLKLEVSSLGGCNRDITRGSICLYTNSSCGSIARGADLA